MTRKAIRFSETEKHELERRAQSHGLTLTDVMRRGARQYLDTLDDARHYAGPGRERRGGRRTKKTKTKVLTAA